MRTKSTKYTIINEFTALKTEKIKNVDSLMGKIETLMKKESDSELRLVLQKLRLHRAEHELKTFLECCEVAQPIFEYMESVDNWGVVELNILSSAIEYNQDYNKTLELFQEIKEVIGGKE